MNPFWSRAVHELEPYTPGEQPRISNLIKLNTNENPYPPSPKVLEALRNCEENKLRRYPDPSATRLREVIAEYNSLETEQVFVGNGSDEVLAHIFKALLKHDEAILFPDISYSFYPVYCGLFDIKYTQVPVGEDFKINASDYAVANGGIIFPNPNAPTGLAQNLDSIEKILLSNPKSVVVVDEAYVDFGVESAVQLINRFANLVVVQTLSKSRALAGLRVGFAMANAELIEALERVKNSFNSYPLGSMSQVGAIAAIEDENWFQINRNHVISSRQKLGDQLASLGFEVLPSMANFLFVRHPQHDAGKLAFELRERNIIVRHFELPRINQFLRITVGTEQQCQVLFETCRDIFKA